MEFLIDARFMNGRLVVVRFNFFVHETQFLLSVSVDKFNISNDVFLRVILDYYLTKNHVFEKNNL